MSPYEYYIIVFMILIANVAGILLVFRRTWRENLRMFFACVLITVITQTYRIFTGDPIGLLSFLPGVWYLPSLYFIHCGSVAQKVFVTFTVLSITHLILICVSFFTVNSMPQRIALLGCALLIYVGMMAWQGRRFTEKVFTSAGGSWWGYAAYTAVFYLLMIRAYGIVIVPPAGEDGRIFFYLLPLFALSGLAIFFVAVLRTHEKTTADLELTFARQTLNTGRSYYESLTDTLEQVRILQHDYQHQLSALSRLAHTEGNREKALEHLDSLVAHYEDNVVESFTSNAVIDALLSHYAMQLRQAGVSFHALVRLPSNTGINNYDLCVVLGNLLSNAFAAVQTAPEGAKRYVKLDIRYKAPQLVICASNSFGGEVRQDESGQLISTREGGGNGTRSIRAVALKYGGVYENEWKDGQFSAYVLLGK